MILTKLSQLYTTLRDDPDVNLCEPGFSTENISFRLVISREGELQYVNDLRQQQGKNMVPAKIMVPKFDAKRTSGTTPYFLWDKSDYVLGIANKAKSAEEVIEEEQPTRHEAFLQLIDTVVQKTQKTSPLIDAIKTFCMSDTRIEGLRNTDYWAEIISGAFIVFTVKDSGYETVFDDTTIVDMWKEYYTSLSEGNYGRSLVSGEETPLASNHPTIKRGFGDKTNVPFISCNLDAAESYHMEKNKVAPIGASEASYIATALNHLVNSERHRVKIADTTLLFWSASTNRFTDLFAEMVGSNVQQIETTSEDLYAFLRSVRHGRIPEEIDDTDTFYILGLSPNSARVSVRMWYENSVAQLSKHIVEHYRDVEIVKQRKDTQQDFPRPYNLIIETAAQHKSDNIPHSVVPDLMYSIFSGQRYPARALSLLITRMRVDQGWNRLSYYRAAFIKAILNRNFRKELTVSLDQQRRDVPYCLGRLFAVLERIQEDASGGSLNATIKDRYFASASSTPKKVFPILMRLSQNHLKKIKGDNQGRAIYHDKQMGEIMEKLEDFPSILSLDQQGEFAIGYYHQRQSFFEKKPKEEKE